MNRIIKHLVRISALFFGVTISLSVFADNEVGTSKTFPDVRQSQSRDEIKPSIGVNVGLANTDNSRSTLGYAIEYGFQPIVPLTSAVILGGYSSQHKADVPTLTRTLLMYKAAYNLGGTIPVIKDSYAGLEFGPVFDNINNKLDVELGVAPVIGFDIPLGGEFASRYSLGANANYMFVGGAKNDVFALNGVAKYWF